MKTILVVDDELAAAEALALILEDEGYRVFCASNGRLGLDRALELRPDLVIADLMMPVMNGADMATQLRGNPTTQKIHIVMNSALAEPQVRERFAGYDVFLRKPYTIDAMLEAVRRLLG